MKDFLILFSIFLILNLLVWGHSTLMPDYEKYVAGEYKESVECDGPKPYCFFVQFGNYKEDKNE